MNAVKSVELITSPCRFKAYRPSRQIKHSAGWPRILPCPNSRYHEGGDYPLFVLIM